MKRCFKCLVIKELSDFYRHPGMGDGHLNKCKSCAKDDVAKNYRKNIDHYVGYEKARFSNPDRKAAVAGYQRKRRLLYPEKDRARWTILNAIRRGKVERKPCSICNASVSEAHHHDYSKPLDVIWLCFSCHRQHAHGQEVH